MLWNESSASVIAESPGISVVPRQKGKFLHAGLSAARMRRNSRRANHRRATRYGPGFVSPLYLVFVTRSLPFTAHHRATRPATCVQTSFIRSRKSIFFHRRIQEAAPSVHHHAVASHCRSRRLLRGCASARHAQFAVQGRHTHLRERPYFDSRLQRPLLGACCRVRARMLH